MAAAWHVCSPAPSHLIFSFTSFLMNLKPEKLSLQNWTLRRLVSTAFYKLSI